MPKWLIRGLKTVAKKTRNSLPLFGLDAKMEKIGNKRGEKPFQPRTIDDPEVKKWPFRNRMGQALSSCCSFQQVDVRVLYIHNNWSIFMPGWNKLLALGYWLYYCTVWGTLSHALTNLHLFLQHFPSPALFFAPSWRPDCIQWVAHMVSYFFPVPLYMQQVSPSLWYKFHLPWRLFFNTIFF